MRYDAEHIAGQKVVIYNTALESPKCLPLMRGGNESAYIVPSLAYQYVASNVCRRMPMRFHPFRASKRPQCPACAQRA